MAVFRFFKVAAVCHLGFLKARNSGLVLRAEIPQCAKFRADQSNLAELWPFFDFLRLQLSAIFNFSKFKILTADPVMKVNVHQRARFSADRSKKCRVMTGFRFFKMAAARHLRFLNVWNINCQCISERQYASPCKMSCELVKPSWRYGHFSIFHDGDYPPSWIFKSSKF